MFVFVCLFVLKGVYAPPVVLEVATSSLRILYPGISHVCI